MISREDFMEIKAQHERGVYMKDIAGSMGVSPRTVKRALERGGPPPISRPNRRGSKLDPYKEFIDSELAAGVWNGSVILVKLRGLGYEGGSTMVREYIKPKRPLRASRATVRFETAPGVQTQSDWGEEPVRIAGEQTTAHFCVNTLGYSRRFHFLITDSEDAEHTCEAQKRAFEHFGGATKEVLVDNQKVAVIDHVVKDGRTERLIFNRRWLDFLYHYGSRGRACKPERAQTKGKDERMVGYVKHNFFLMFPEAESLADYNNKAEWWLANVADPRVHGTTGRVVSEMFEEEREHLLPLPSVPFDTSYVEFRIVACDSMVEVRGNRYSVPDSLCGQPVQVRIGLNGILRVFSDEELVATHRLKPLREGWSVVPEHHENLWANVLAVEKRSLSVYEEVMS